MHEHQSFLVQQEKKSAEFSHILLQRFREAAGFRANFGRSESTASRAIAANNDRNAMIHATRMRKTGVKKSAHMEDLE